MSAAEFKVFVGNLSYDTTEEQLKEIFAAHGSVSSVQIITRRVRKRRNKDEPAPAEGEEFLFLSLGYGFVTFEKEQDAQAAVDALDKQEFGGRALNVELARPMDGDRPRRPRGRGRGRGGRGGRGGRKGGRSHSRKEDRSKSASQTRAKSQEKPTEPSKTTVFVSNLPFSLNDDGLVQFFTENGFKVVKAHVASRHFRGQKRSKGFGFVELSSNDEQKQAVEKLDGKELDERKLTVKVAFSVAAPEEKKD